MSAVYICECEHPKSQHKRERDGCRALDCYCARFEADMAASAAAQGAVRADSSGPSPAPAVVDVREVRRAAAAAALGFNGESTSARLRRVEQERDELARRAAHLEQENERREETIARNVQERDRALDDRDAIREQRDLARAELAEAYALVEKIPGRTPIEVLREVIAAGQDAQVESAVAASFGPVLTRFAMYACLTCGSRYGKPYTDHEHGPLTPVTVTITQGAPTA